MSTLCSFWEPMHAYGIVTLVIMIVKATLLTNEVLENSMWYLQWQHKRMNSSRMHIYWLLQWSSQAGVSAQGDVCPGERGVSQGVPVCIQGGYLPRTGSTPSGSRGRHPPDSAADTPCPTACWDTPHTHCMLEYNPPREQNHRHV